MALEVIGVVLSVKVDTVKKHLDHIYAKLGVATRTDATVRALQLGLAGRASTTARASPVVR